MFQRSIPKEERFCRSRGLTERANGGVADGVEGGERVVIPLKSSRGLESEWKVLMNKLANLQKAETR